MGEMAIRAKGLGKYYRLGEIKGLRALTGPVRRSVRRWRGLPEEDASEAFWALRGVDFEIQRGDVVGVIGRNGAGKSTLLKVLSRIVEPSEGRCEIRGRVGSLLEVGTGFHPELTGRENILLNGAILGMKQGEIRRRFDEIVEFAEVGRFIDTPVKRYSSGMYMRLAFSVAAHLEPEVLIVDEVLAVGDTAFQTKCLGRMNTVATQGRTVLFVSHNMAAIQQLCTRAILMKKGRVQLDGSVPQAVAEYHQDALSSTDGVFDVTQTTVRDGKYEPIIRSVTLRVPGRGSTARFRPQDGMEVELRLQSAKPIREPRVAVTIDDLYGRRLTTVASYFMERPLPTLSGEMTVRCTIPQLNLGTGRYLLGASVSDTLKRLVDSIDGVAAFDVDWDNSYGNGEPFDPVFGPVMTESRWDVVEGRPATRHMPEATSRGV